MNKDTFIKVLNQKNNKFAQLVSKNYLQTADSSSSRILNKYVLSQIPNKLKVPQNGSNTLREVLNKKRNNIPSGGFAGPKLYVASEKQNNHLDKIYNESLDMLQSFEPVESIVAASSFKHHYLTQQKRSSPEAIVKRVHLKNTRDFKNLQKCLFPPANFQRRVDTPKMPSKVQMFKDRNDSINQQTIVKSTNILEKSKNQFHDSPPSLVRKSSNISQRMRSLAKETKLNLQKIKNINLQLEQEHSKQLQRKNLSQSYSKPFIPPNNMTAYSYIIYQPNFSSHSPKSKISNKYVHSHKIHLSVNSRNSVEVASLTKIMTCIVAIQLCQRFNLDQSNQQVLIGKFQSNIGGTSANISIGQIYTLQQLLYGLMLPSGNDASLAIAVWGGRVLLHFEQQKQIMQINGTEIGMKFSKYKKKQCYNRFLMEMNTKAKDIGLQKTNYANSHGLINYMNKSCSYDIAVLCQYALNNEKFQNIVNTKQYQCQIKYVLQDKKTFKSYKKTIGSTKRLNKKLEQDNDEQKQLQDEDLEQEQDSNSNLSYGKRFVNWQNTHQLLHEKPKLYVGIKTGITTAAGPCLASCVQTQDNRKFIIIVLGCKKLSYRFKQTQILRKWIFKRQGLLKSKQQPDSRTKYASQREYSDDSENQDD